MPLPELIGIVRDVTAICVTLFGSVYVFRQIREVRKGRHFGAFLEFEKRIDAQREERRLLYEWNGPRDDQWRSAFERVAVTFDILGVLVREDILYTPFIFKPYWDVIIKTWDCVRDHIIDERRRKSLTYMDDFETLYKEADKYRQAQKYPYPQIHAPVTLSASQPSNIPLIASQTDDNAGGTS